MASIYRELHAFQCLIGFHSMNPFVGIGAMCGFDHKPGGIHLLHLALPIPTPQLTPTVIKILLRARNVAHACNPRYLGH